MDPHIVSIYNEYIHGAMPRREFLRRVAELAGGAAAAAALVRLLEPDYARGQQVSPQDDRLTTAFVDYPGTTGTVRGYLAKPAGMPDKAPGVLVIHENRGLNAHIQDVARRAALQGYVALAPDGLTHVGGAPQDQEEARDVFGKADRDTITADVIAGVPYLAAREDCTGRVGTVGFCYGGGVSLQCAAHQPATAAAVCFYGRAITQDETANVTAPLMMHYAGEDERVNAGLPEFRAALDRHGVSYSIHMYPGTGHGFHNDTSSARYHPEAAALAWKRTIRFFEDFL
jgi:carboxymethylenebutenolidase